MYKSKLKSLICVSVYSFSAEIVKYISVINIMYMGSVVKAENYIERISADALFNLTNGNKTKLLFKCINLKLVHHVYMREYKRWIKMSKYYNLYKVFLIFFFLRLIFRCDRYIFNYFLISFFFFYISFLSVVSTCKLFSLKISFICYYLYIMYIYVFSDFII